MTMYVLLYILWGMGMFFLTVPPAQHERCAGKIFFFRLSLAALLFAFFMGARYDVGRDWLPMCRIYLDRLEGTENYYLEHHYSPVFYYLTTFFADNQVHYSVYFFIMALMQIAGLFYSLKNFPWVISSVILCFFWGCTWYGWANIARQSVAQVFVLSAICMLSEKKKIWCALFMVLAVLSHQSALIIVPFLFLYGRDFKPVRISQQILFVLIALMFSLLKINIIRTAMHIGVAIPFFSKYAHLLEFEEWLAPSPLGVGFFIYVLLNLTLVFFSDEVKKYYNSKFVNFLYLLFYLGVLLEYVTIANMLLSRINVYFIGVRFILCGFYLYYFWCGFCRKSIEKEDDKTERKMILSSSGAKILAMLIVVMNMLTFAGYISKGEDVKIKYNFYWNMDGFELEEAKGELFK